MQEINIVKIGSAGICEENIKQLLDDIELFEKQTNEKFMIISSGAVKLGKNIIERKGKNINNYSHGALASIGQSELITMYKILSKKLVGQILLDDYANNEYVNALIAKVRSSLGKVKINGVLTNVVNKVLHLVNDNKDKHLLEIIKDLIENDELVVVNHNDTLSSLELKGLTNRTDNDKNVVYLAYIFDKYGKEFNMRINRVIYLTDTDGILDKSGKTYNSGFIDELELEKSREETLSFLQDKKSSDGTGGMGSKINGSFDCLVLGVREALIANVSNGLKFLFEKENKSKVSTFSLQRSKIK